MQAVLALTLIIGANLIANPAVLYSLGVIWLLIAAIVVFVVQIFLMLPMRRST